MFDSSAIDGVTRWYCARCAKLLAESTAGPEQHYGRPAEGHCKS